ncbi:GNAT family N-acetyltransferase [Kytococcus schroeteri]|uniref:GNAT family N-acetyltransferase n=1 Tax=Kytococcus schroeteri TaxID=138300 RepID=UPI0022AB24C8|nr:GNAT family N-acetyltransferase [Kytococcus schroeteri]
MGSEPPSNPGRFKDYPGHVDCLIYRKGGEIVATLNHFPVAMGPERAGAVNVLVLPAFRRQGIGSALWEEARRRRGVKADGQKATPLGERFLAAEAQADQVIPSAFRATAPDQP